MYTDRNIIGSRGEMLATAILMTGQVFSAELLGGKVPSFDVYVEVYDSDKPYPFLVQIKSTTMNDMYNQNSINTPVPDGKLVSLCKRPIPTYVAGFDMIQNILYIAPAFTGSEHYPSIPLTHKVELYNPTAAEVELRKLKDDIIAFYDNNNIPTIKKTYTSTL